MDTREFCNTRIPGPSDRERQDEFQAAPVNQETKRGPTPEFHDDLRSHPGREELQRAANPKAVAKDKVQLRGSVDHRGVS